MEPAAKNGRGAAFASRDPRRSNYRGGGELGRSQPIAERAISATRASCFWVYAYPAFLRYAAHSAGGYWVRILPQASEIAS